MATETVQTTEAPPRARPDARLIAAQEIFGRISTKLETARLLALVGSSSSERVQESVLSTLSDLLAVTSMLAARAVAAIDGSEVVDPDDILFEDFEQDFLQKLEAQQ